jgi:hypothetical protein
VVVMQGSSTHVPSEDQDSDDGPNYRTGIITSAAEGRVS